MDTPVTIPNTEVKPLNADGTWLVTTWESRKLPDRRFSSAIIFIGSAYRLSVGKLFSIQLCILR